MLADGTKFHYTARASHLLDARPWYDPNFFKARTTLFQSVSGQWLQVENSADYVNEPNPFTLASSHPKPRITMVSSSPFSVDFFPEGGVPPKPSEELLRLYPQPMEDVAAPSTPEGVAPPRTPWDENAQNTRGREPTEHQGREPAEHQGREPAEHQGREPAEHQGPEPEGDDLAMLPEGLEQAELEAYAANNAAEQLQGLDRRDPVPRSQPEGPPSAEEVAAHNLTHVPFQRWCESCVATRSRADAHHTGANRETKVPVVQIDFYFTSLDDHARPAGQGEQDTCCLIGVDLETKMVLSVPGPNKGAVILHRAAEEVTRFTISLHGDEAVILQSDGEPAIKAVARAVAAARSKLGKKTVQRTTPVAAHQSNGGAERAVQTVRRLGTCLFHALELKAGTFPADTPLKLWAQVHGAFLYNRFHVLPGVLHTPYELAYGGRKFTKALCVFGETVFGQVLRTHKGEPRWIQGLWVGMSTTSGANHLMTTYGHIQSESVRRATEEQQLTANQVEDMCITGWPWNRDHVEQPRRRKKEPRRAEAAPTLEAGVQLPLGAPPGHPLLPEEDNEAQAVEAAAKGKEADTDSSEELRPADPKDVPLLRSPSRSARPSPSRSPAFSPSFSPRSVSPTDPTDRARGSGQGPGDSPATKRKAEEMSGGGGADTTAEPAELVHQPGPGETMDADEEFAVRMVETVDAAWHEAWENAAYTETEDFDGEQPPDLSPDDLAELDDQAEIEELTRLEGMSVLMEPNPQQAEHLSTVFVKTWKKGPDGWFRRARLVARQYRWASDMLEEDTFSPASVSTLARVVPVLAQKWGTPIYIMDVKDAYLCVPQPEDEPVVVTAPRSYVNKFGASKTWKLGRVLPGQRRGAQEWYHQLAGDLTNASLESMPEVPTLYRASGNGERYVAQVHVDDIMATGDAEPHGRVEKDLTDRYTVKIAGPYQQPGDEFEFLKRRYQIQSDGSITVRAPVRLCNDLFELAGKPKVRATPGPSGQDDMFAADATEELSPREATAYRTMLGKVLYMSNERPDAQAVIQNLSSRAAQPTAKAMKLMKHLVGYLWGTQGYGVNLCLAPGKAVMNFARGKLNPDEPIAEHLVEGYSDSNFANDRTTRKSLSSGQIYIDQALMYSFVRGQKVVTLSSGEAELVALTQATSEAILVHKAWVWTTKEEAKLVMRSDSSVARAIASRLGVGRVRHLQTSCLWIQQWVAAKTLRVAAVPTQFNPSDMGTKSLQQRRLRMLCFLAGMVDDHGEHIGREEHAEALGRDVLGRAGGDLMVRMVQALMAITMQGCNSPSEDQAGNYLEAVLFYFVEVFYANPVFFLAAILTYVLVTSRWTLSFSVSSRGPAGSDAATQTNLTTADKETETDKPKGTRPNKQPEKETESQRDPRREPETLEEAKQRLYEQVTYEDLFPPGPGLEPATGVAPEVAASASSSATRFPAERTEARVSLSVQRRGFLECATKCLKEHDLDTECWVTEFGYAYHRRSCGNLKHARNLRKVTAREAIDNGKAACNQCFADHWVPTVKYRFPGLNL